MALTVAGLDRLKSQLLTSGLQQRDQPLYQVINQLIDYVRQGFTSVDGQITDITGGSGGGGMSQSFVTTQNELGTLSNSRRIVAGSGVNINNDGQRLIINSEPIPFPGEIVEGPMGPPGIQGPQGPMGLMGPPGMDGLSCESELILPYVSGFTGKEIQPYTPQWLTSGVAPAIGNGVLAGYYYIERFSKLIWVHVFLEFGSTTTNGTGTYLFTLPINAFGTGLQALTTNLNALAYDVSAGIRYSAIASTSVGSSDRFFMVRPDSTIINDVNPTTWATGDLIHLSGWYVPIIASV